MPSPSDPASFDRRALVCAVGLAPQILTETVYALAGRPGQKLWCPTEVHVLTTGKGAARLEELVTAGSDSVWQRLSAHCLGLLPTRTAATRELPLKVHVISAEGSPIQDIEDEAQSIAAADTILRVMADLSADEGCAIHASLAGGRKTMGFFLGYALSLLGRPQDRLSHVLVTPSAVENHPQFFYPPAEPFRLSLREGATISTADVRIGLAPVPVVLFANGLRQKVAQARQGYAHLVEQAQQDLVGDVVEIFPAARVIRVGEVSMLLEPAEMALYLHLALMQRDEVQWPGLSAAGLVKLDKDSRRSAGVAAQDLRTAYHRVGLALPTAPLELDDFKPRMSAINKSISRSFGEKTAQRLMIVGPRERGKRDSQYGLIHLEPASIHIG